MFKLEKEFFNLPDAFLELKLSGWFTYQNPDAHIKPAYTLGERLRAANDEDFIIIVDGCEIKVRWLLKI